MYVCMRVSLEYSVTKKKTIRAKQNNKPIATKVSGDLATI